MGHTDRNDGYLHVFLNQSFLFAQREIEDEVEEREGRLDAANQQYYDLQGELQDMLHRITQETQDMRRMEQDLKDGE